MFKNVLDQQSHKKLSFSYVLWSSDALSSSMLSIFVRVKWFHLIGFIFSEYFTFEIFEKISKWTRKKLPLALLPVLYQVGLLN